MRILIVTMNLPYPPASGGAIRVHGIAEGLRRAGHDVHLLCFHDGEANIDGLQIETVPPPQRSTLDRLRDLLLSDQPDIAGRFSSDAFAGKLREILNRTQFDVIQFEGIESISYQPIAKETQPAAKRCFDTFNAEYALQRNISEVDRQTPGRLPAALYSQVQSRRIERFEGEMCRMADAVIAVSEEDAELLKGFRADKRVHVVPNGIWVERYDLTEDNTPDLNQPTQIGGPVPISEQTLVFTGKMDYRPNVDAMLWFTESVFPQIRAQVPEAYLYIVGQQPHERLSHLTDRKGVQLTGWVESVLPYLQTATVYVAPLRMGSGTRLKLLEAMACGCAIVATPTASSGLTKDTRESMIIVEQAGDMATHIIDLLRNPERRQQMGHLARRRVQEEYDWSTLIPRLLAVYEEIGVSLG